MTKKNQSKRLTNQHKESKGVVGIFGDEAKSHDITVGKISLFVIEQLEKEFPQLSFQYKTSIKKEEINEALKKIDPELGQTLFVSNSSIIPDGGIIVAPDSRRVRSPKWFLLLQRSILGNAPCTLIETVGLSAVADLNKLY
ncbi:MULTISPECIES: EcoRI family type II restriction endonuclease [unclassified Microcystis]|uniref:EcoRI family type II restriction endonuclease n=1 Tax=unclassified Microcystis TaxID=2643300 RepID=UPI00257B7C12|nr:MULTISPECIES: EcoRI family type II restriction endonuclease [unclassified Microcystis]